MTYVISVFPWSKTKEKSAFLASGKDKQNGNQLLQIPGDPTLDG